MNKIISLILSVFLMLVITGCTKTETVSYQGISFEYPKDLMTVSYNDFDQFDGANIDISTGTVTTFMKHCAELYVEVERSKSINEANLEFINALEYLRDKGVNADVKDLKTVTCGWGGSNSSAQSIQIDGINGVVYTKVFGNSGLPNLNSFAKQVLLVNPQNEVYSMIFNYHFGELGDYIDSLIDENGYQGYLDGDEDHLWDQVRDYFAYGNDIVDENMKMFEDNDLVIQKVIDSIRIEN
jgi:hypothetical protein